MTDAPAHCEDCGEEFADAAVTITVDGRELCLACAEAMADAAQGGNNP